MNQIDPTHCPTCDEPNVCAMEKAKVTGSKPERCWYMDAVFTPAVMDQVPDAAKGKACVCAKCASAVNLSAEIRFEPGMQRLTFRVQYDSEECKINQPAGKFVIYKF